MQFWFCETCGKRLTDKDLEEGAARNKKLKGVFCKECSVGVMTMEMDAINIEELAQARARSSSSAASTPPSGTKGSASNLAAVRSASGIEKSGRSSTQSKKASSSGEALPIPMPALLGGTAVLVVAVLALALSHGKSNEAPRHAVDTAAVSVQPPHQGDEHHDVPRTVKENPLPREVATPSGTGLPAPPVKSAETNPHPPESIEPSHPQGDGAVPPAETETPRSTRPPDAVPSAGPTAPPTDDADKGSKPGKEAVATPPVPAGPVPVPPAPVTPVFPSVFKPEQREAWQFLERVFVPLRKGDIGNAIQVCNAGNVPISKAIVATLERARQVFQRGVDNLRKNPPSGEIKLTWNKLEVKGRMVRIDESHAWIMSENMEVPLEFGAIPHEYLLQALNFDEKDPKSLGDQAALLFSWGNIDQAEAILKKAGSDGAADLREALEQQQALKRLNDFEVTAEAAESAIKNGQRANAMRYVDKLTHEFPTLMAGEQKARIEFLADGAKNCGLANTRVRKVIKGEVVSVDDSLNVEVHYDFVKNQKGIGDFVLNGARLDGTGLVLPATCANEDFLQAASARHVARFQPGTFRIEYVINARCFDVTMAKIGGALIKNRWAGGGVSQILITFEPRFSVNITIGALTKIPEMNGTHRHVYERTPELVRYEMDGKEYANQPIPKKVTPEVSWPLGIASYQECSIKEITLKGRLDPAWLKEAESK